MTPPPGASPSPPPSEDTSGAEAEKATAGPWQNGIDDLEGVVAPYQPGLGNVICIPPTKRMYSSLEHWDDNAAYIAAASPDRVLALLDEVERAKTALREILARRTISAMHRIARSALLTEGEKKDV